MPSHRLILDNNPKGGEWLLEWDQTTLTIYEPDGELAFEIPVSRAHWAVELGVLDTYAKVSFATDEGDLTFRRNKQAVRDVRGLVLEGLRSDHIFREMRKRQARISIPQGIAMFIICGGVFALFCWWAIGAEDPPANSVAYKVLACIGWLIHAVLLVMLGLALAGILMLIGSVRELRCIRMIERGLAVGESVKFVGR